MEERYIEREKVKEKERAGGRNEREGAERARE
jgi:hypothetical protein